MASIEFLCDDFDDELSPFFHIDKIRLVSFDRESMEKAHNFSELKCLTNFKTIIVKENV